MNIHEGWRFLVRQKRKNPILGVKNVFYPLAIRKIDKDVCQFILSVFIPEADRVSELFSNIERVREINLLRLKAMAHVLIVRANSGLDISLLQQRFWVTSIDSDASKLQRASRRNYKHFVTIELIDLQHLKYAGLSFNAIIPNLGFDNVPISAAPFQIAERITTNRRFLDVIENKPDMFIERNETGELNGCFQSILIWREHSI